MHIYDTRKSIETCPISEALPRKSVLTGIPVVNPAWSLFYVSGWAPRNCKAGNWSDDDPSLKQRGLPVWFDPDAHWKAGPAGKRGRQPQCNDVAIQACLTIKALFGLTLRQTAGVVDGLLKCVDLDPDVPDFSTLCRRQKSLPMAISYQGSKGPLHLFVDGTGIKAEGERAQAGWAKATALAQDPYWHG